MFSIQLRSRATLSLGLLLGALVLGGCASPAIAKAPTALAPREGDLKRDAMQQDLDFWLETLEAVHPDPYSKVPRETFLARFDAARAALPASQDPLAFYATIQRLAASLGDSHTLVHYPPDSRAYGEHLWSLPTVVREGHLIVGSSVPGLPKGSELTRVDRFPVPELLREAAALNSAERAEAALLDAPDSLGAALWLLGARAPFRVEGKSPAGAPVVATLPGARPSDASSDSPTAVEPFRLDWLEPNIAYLFIGSMGDVDGFAEFIANAAVDIERKHAGGLIVDLRQNSGGSTEVGELLLQRITSKPYRQVAEKYWLVSKQYQANVSWSDEYLAAEPGVLFHYTFEAEPPKHVATRFDGPVCFLIGPGTVSAAMMLANTAEDYHLATLIGEPTASPPNYFGEVYSFELPSTHLPAQASVARFVRANGEASNANPVMPEIRIAPTTKQWTRGDDVVLARARAWLTAATPSDGRRPH